MRTLVLFAHPVETSFAAAAHRTIVESLTAAGHEVDDCDLYAEGFNPVLSREERLNYHDVEICTKPVQSYVDRLRAAEALVLNFPVWNYGYPAILKGFFDRVFLPGVSFKLANGRTWPNLSQHPQARRGRHLWRRPLAHAADGRSAEKGGHPRRARRLPSARQGPLRRPPRHEPQQREGPRRLPRAGRARDAHASEP